MVIFGIRVKVGCYGLTTIWSGGHMGIRQQSKRGQKRRRDKKKNETVYRKNLLLDFRRQLEGDFGSEG